MRALAVIGRLLPFILAFLRDRRRWIVTGPPARRTLAQHQRRADELVAALAGLGPTFIKLGQVFAARVAQLTPRERDVCVLVVRGLLNKQIAGELGVSERTVKSCRAELMRKLGAGSLVDLVRLGTPLLSRTEPGA